MQLQRLKILLEREQHLSSPKAQSFWIRRLVRRYDTISTARLVLLLPIPENVQKVGFGFRFQMVFGQLTDELNRRPHLAEVRTASLAACEMGVKPLTVLRRQTILQIGCDQFYEFLARYCFNIHGF